MCISEVDKFMKMYRYNSHLIIRDICLSICIAGVLVISFYYNKVQKILNTELVNLFLYSEDGANIVTWDSPNWNICDYVTIQISDDNGIVYEKNVWPIIEKISYKSGEHGKAYVVSAVAHYRDGAFGDTIKKRTLFFRL